MCHAVWAYQRSARHAMDARRRFRAARAPRGGRQGGGRAKGREGKGRGGGCGRRWRGSTSAALDRSWRNAIEPRWRRLCARRKGPRWWGDGKKRPRAARHATGDGWSTRDKFGRERRRRFETAKRCSYSRRVEPRWTTFERRASETHFRPAREDAIDARLHRARDGRGARGGPGRLRDALRRPGRVPRLHYARSPERLSRRRGSNLGGYARPRRRGGRGGGTIPPRSTPRTRLRRLFPTVAAATSCSTSTPPTATRWRLDLPKRRHASPSRVSRRGGVQPRARGALDGDGAQFPSSAASCPARSARAR